MALRKEPKSDKEVEFSEFYCEVKEIEKRDSVLTPKQQIERLLRPGSTYFNLNPFEVLQVEPDTSIEDVKKQYRRLSILVHPDKNQEDVERAQQAFEVVNRSWKILDNEVSRQKCMDIIDEAKGRTDLMLVEKRKKARKEGRHGIPEDDPEKYKHSVYVLTMKLFADMERKRRELASKDQEERKRKREQEIDEEENMKAQKEWQKNFEESRQNRVDSWLSFQAGGSSSSSSSGVDAAAAAVVATAARPKVKTHKKLKIFKPPKPKPETR